MEDCNSVSTPFNSNNNWATIWNQRTKRKRNIKKIPYREVVKKFQYASQEIKPDIIFTVNSINRYLDRYLENPDRRYWSTIKRIMRYFKGTLDLGKLKFNRNQIKDFINYCDWQNETFITGSFLLQGELIVWQSKRQDTVLSLPVNSWDWTYSSLANQEMLWLQISGKEIFP